MLQKAEVRIINHSVCNDLMKGQLTSRMLCAGVLTGGVDACQVIKPLNRILSCFCFFIVSAFSKNILQNNFMDMQILQLARNVFVNFTAVIKDKRSPTFCTLKLQRRSLCSREMGRATIRCHPRPHLATLSCTLIVS